MLVTYCNTWVATRHMTQWPTLYHATDTVTSTRDFHRESVILYHPKFWFVRCWNMKCGVYLYQENIKLLNVWVSVTANLTRLSTLLVTTSVLTETLSPKVGINILNVDILQLQSHVNICMKWQNHDIVTQLFKRL